MERYACLKERSWNLKSRREKRSTLLQYQKSALTWMNIEPSLRVSAVLPTAREGHLRQNALEYLESASARLIISNPKIPRMMEVKWTYIRSSAPQTVEKEITVMLNLWCMRFLELISQRLSRRIFVFLGDYSCLSLWKWYGLPDRKVTS